MRKTAINILCYIILLGVICAMFYHYRVEIITIFTRVRWSYIGLLSLLHIPMIALGGLSFKFLCSHYHIHLKWKDWAGLSFVANFINQLLPYRLGMVFRYVYMKQHFQMSNTQFFCITLIYVVFTVLISAVFALIGWLMSDIPHNFNALFYATCFVGIVFVSFIIWLKISHFSAKRRFGEIAKALQLLIAEPSIFFLSLLSLICVSLLTTILFYMCLIAIKAPLPISQCLFLVGILTVAMLFQLTPGNIGVLEALFGTLTQVIYHDFSMGFAAIALYRVSQWIPSIILGSSFSFALIGSIIPSVKNTRSGATNMVN